jgi:PAS domain S-box-containing protein
MDRNDEDEVSFHGRQVPAWALAALACLGVALCVATGLIAGSAPEEPGRAVVLHVLLVAAPMAAGLYAVSGSRASRFGWVLVVAGLLWAPTVLAESSNSLAYSTGRIFAWLVEPMVIYMVLAFPTGRLLTGLDKSLFRAAFGLLVILYLPTALVVDQYPLPTPWAACVSGCPHNAFMVTSSQPAVVDSLISPVRDFALVALAVAILVVLARRMAQGTRLMRRALGPVLSIAIVRLGFLAAFVVIRRTSPDSDGARAAGDVVLFCTPALALGFLAGLLRWRFFAVSAVRRLTTDFIGPPSGRRVRELLATAFEDPSLEIVYWAPEPGQWVDAEGMPVELPGLDSERAVTEVIDRGRRVAAFVHDRALADQPILSEVAGGFAVVALENQRLDAELRSSLRELSGSRARIISAADKERRRIERDLHDGAQQRLVALGIKLELARERVQQRPDESPALLRGLVTDVDEALDEVRSLAHGVYPAQLSDHGLADALRVAAHAGTLPVTVSATGLGRYSQQLESAVYFCCLEALQNAAKHASGATGVTLTLADERGERVQFEIVDDGPGLPETIDRGDGLANMRDRIDAVGGTLEVGNGEDGGTRVAGFVPLGAVELSPELEPLLRRATDAIDECFGVFRAVRDESGAVDDFLVEHVNEAACVDIGLPREDEIGRTLGELVPGYRRSPAFRWHRRALEGDGPTSTEDLDFAGPLTDARHLRRAYDVHASPLGGDRLVLSWRDITKRKRAELERRTRSLALDRASEAVSLVRASDRLIVYANSRFEDLFGYEADELVGLPVSLLNWEREPGDAARRAAEIEALLEPRGEASFELHNRRKDDTSLWTTAHVSAFEDPDHGRVWALVQHESAGGESLREPPSILPLGDGAAFLVFTLDQELRYTWVFDRRSGLAANGDAAGLTDGELFGPDAVGGVSEAGRRVLETGRGVRTSVNGFELTAEPLLGRSGEVEGVAGVASVAAGPVLGP